MNRDRTLTAKLRTAVNPMHFTTLLFALGTFLPSLAEDILARGYLYQHLKSKTTGFNLALLSSTVYVLNHGYALGNGAAQLLFLFVLGLVLAVLVVHTRNLWYTVGVHWAGDIVYRVGNDVLSVRHGTNSCPSIGGLLFSSCSCWSTIG